jgi:DNA-binding MarR family transcriptional regulator
VVVLTDAGRTALARAHAHLEAVLGAWLSELPPDRTLLALDAITRLATGRDDAPEPEPATAER